MELFIGIIFMIFLYWFGGLLFDDTPHHPIQQELIKMEEE